MVGDGDDLVGLYVDVEGDESEFGVYAIFGWFQLAGADLFKIARLAHAEVILEYGHGLVNLAHRGVGDDTVVHAVGAVVGQGLSEQVFCRWIGQRAC